VVLRLSIDLELPVSDDDDSGEDDEGDLAI
jgi:hypothetical protein